MKKEIERAGVHYFVVMNSVEMFENKALLTNI